MHALMRVWLLQADKCGEGKSYLDNEKSYLCLTALFEQNENDLTRMNTYMSMCLLNVTLLELAGILFFFLF